jgi:ABC-2 type transport system ATP-binding protein
MIEVENLTKVYGTRKAVDGINFTVNDGEILGLLGPNGAGKSTTMNMLTGYISSSSGSARINGVDILDDPVKAKSYIGYLPEIPPLYVDMTVKSYLNFIYDLKKCKLPRKQHIHDVCTLCRINDVYDRIIKNLSKGYRQRVGLAQALINNPPVLILDEPTVGLDPKQIIEIRTLIKKLGRNHTVIISSHILSEIQAVCDRVVIINKGVVQADGTTDNLSKAVTGENKIIVRIDGDKSEVLQKLRTIDGIKSINADIQREENTFDYEIESESDIDIRIKVNELAKENDWNIMMLNLGTMTLEDIFLKITMGEDVPSNQDSKPAVNTEKSENSEETEQQENEEGGNE